MITLSLKGVKDVRFNIKEKLADSRISACREYHDVIYELDYIIDRAGLLDTLTDELLKVTLPDELIQKIYNISYYFDE